MLKIEDGGGEKSRYFNRRLTDLDEI